MFIKSWLAGACVVLLTGPLPSQAEPSTAADSKPEPSVSRPEVIVEHLGTVKLAEPLGPQASSDLVALPGNADTIVIAELLAHPELSRDAAGEVVLLYELIVAAVLKGNSLSPQQTVVVRDAATQRPASLLRRRDAAVFFLSSHPDGSWSLVEPGAAAFAVRTRH